MCSPREEGNTSPCAPLWAWSCRCSRTRGIRCSGMATSRFPASVLGSLTTMLPGTNATPRRTLMVPLVVSTSPRRSSVSSPLRRAHQAARSTMSRYCWGGGVDEGFELVQGRRTGGTGASDVAGPADVDGVAVDELVVEGGVEDVAQQVVGVFARVRGGRSGAAVPGGDGGPVDLGEGELSECRQEMVLEQLAVVVPGAGGELAVGEPVRCVAAEGLPLQPCLPVLLLLDSHLGGAPVPRVLADPAFAGEPGLGVDPGRERLGCCVHPKVGAGVARLVAT